MDTSTRDGLKRDELQLLLQNRTAVTATILCLCIALRAAAALHPYSGEGLPPIHGDYEAQRHWMEVTLNVPVSDWYRNTTDNDLSYWGLDYPPLSAYASFLFGKFIRLIEPATVQLHTSRGYETPSSRFAMRSTVLFVDIILLFPATVSITRLLYPHTILSQVRTLSFALTSPALVLIDHAHFQYNNFTMALFLFSVCSLFLGNHEAVAAALYCAAIFFKQTTIYYTLAIFSWLLGRTIFLWRSAQKRQAAILTLKVLTSITIVTLATFLPWMTSANQIKTVLLRLVPLSRGLYEDKVANMWCTLSPVLKVHMLFTQPQLFFLCASLTFLASLPFCIALVIKPTAKRLLLSCSGCALSAFLFSYQVHEKQILLPLVPLLFLHPHLPFISTYMSLVTVSSLFPLLWRERSYIAYFAMIIIHVSATMVLVPSRPAILKCKSDRFDKHCKQFIHQNRWLRKRRFPNMLTFCVLISVLLHFTLMTISPPLRWPFLFELANTAYAFFHLCIIYILLTVCVFTSD